MLIKCMLPISIVENPGFRAHYDVFDPSFKMPSRNSIKRVVIPILREKVKNLIKYIFKLLEILLHIANIYTIITFLSFESKRMKWLNVSFDGWSDETMRCFNGLPEFLVQYVCPPSAIYSYVVGTVYPPKQLPSQSLKHIFQLVVQPVQQHSNKLK